MNLRLLHILLISLFVYSGASAEDVRRYELKVGDFTKLQIDNDLNVDYRCVPDSAGIAVFSATKGQSSMLIFDNNGKGRLSIQIDTDCQPGHKLPLVTIYSSTLIKVVNSGDSLVRVEGLPHMDKFSAILVGNGRLAIHAINATKVNASIHSGNGQLIVTGACTTAKLHLVGTGIIQADRLDAVTVKASVVGTGTIGCNATESLTVMGMGSGHVYYRTTPMQLKSRGVGIKHELLDGN